MTDGRAPLVLLSNDDGYQAPGLMALREALRAEGAQVVVCAPLGEQSAASHGLSIGRPVRLHEAEPGLFAVDGTPADCVYVALHGGDRVLPRRPDVVVSGINRGPNLGLDVVYSGTVAAAREAALRGLPALATSMHPKGGLEEAARLSARACLALGRLAPAKGEVSEESPVRGPLLSLNIPKGEGPWPLRCARLGHRVYAEQLEMRMDPRRKEYFWLGGNRVTHPHYDGSDTTAFDAQEASLTPLTMSLDAWPSDQDGPAIELAHSLVKELASHDS